MSNKMFTVSNGKSRTFVTYANSKEDAIQQAHEQMGCDIWKATELPAKKLEISESGIPVIPDDFLASDLMDPRD